METKKTLKDKLGVRDFVCRGAGACVPDLCESYYMTARTVQNGLSQKMQSDLKAQGYSKETLSALLQVDDNLLESIFNNNPNIANEFDDSDFGEEYQKNKATIQKIKDLLEKDKSIPTDKRKTLENELEEANKLIVEFKQQKIKEKVNLDPQVIMKSPKALKAMIGLVVKDTKIEKIELDKDGVLLSMQREIIEKFILGKKEEHELLDLPPLNKHLFSKADFFELVNEICTEKENLMSENATDFFTSMRNLKS